MNSTYLPTNVFLKGAESYVSWLPFRTLDLPEPFFFGTLQRMVAAGIPESRTGLETLAQFADVNHNVSVGFIFHVSHCGSTLFANALKTVPDSLVVSELMMITNGSLLAPNDGGLWGPYSDRKFREALLRGTIGALAVNGPRKRYLFIKFIDSPALYLPLFRRLFPRIPFLFLYRDPAEVVARNLVAMTEQQNADRIKTLGPVLGKGLTWNPSPATFWSTLIEAECVAASITECVDILDYRDLSPETAVQAMRRLGVAEEDLDFHAITGAFSRYSKDPGSASPFSREKHERSYESRRKAALPADYAGALAAYRRLGALSRVPSAPMVKTAHTVMGPREVCDPPAFV